VGNGEVDKLVALIDEQDRALRKAKDIARQAAIAELQAVGANVAEFCQLVDLATRIALVVTGHHQHHRGEWRYKRADKKCDAVAGGR
jgi:hypothetical protein